MNTKITGQHSGEWLSMMRSFEGVVLMGHQLPDHDAIGSMAGMAALAIEAGIPVSIAPGLPLEGVQPAIDSLADDGIPVLTEPPENIARCVIVVVDTQRSTFSAYPKWLPLAGGVAVIDHHRRSVDYIDDAVLNFHEPHASSASELVTELLQYLVDSSDILRIEAEALLAGLVLDTKGFSINTGSGTFEAAAFLRRIGAEVTAVKRLLQSDLETTTARYALMREAIMYKEGITIAAGNEEYSRVEIAQAADELLNIQGINTSFVVASTGDHVFVSGRSIGGLNVQVVLEKLGGGGSQSTAGLQVTGMSVEEVVEKLKKAIDSCAR